MITKEQLGLQKQVLNQYWKEVYTKPHFIDNMIFDNIVLREQMQDAWTDISLLLDSRFLTNKSIENIYDRIYDILTVIMASDITIGCLYCNYVEDLIHHYMEWTEELELYETASNLKKFLDIWDIEK